MPTEPDNPTREIIETRLDAMDKALQLLQARSDREPSVSQVFDAVTHLGEIVDVQFKSTAEAAKKTEDGFTKQLDANKLNVETQVNGLRIQIEDLKKAPLVYVIILVGLAVNAAALWFRH